GGDAGRRRVTRRGAAARRGEPAGAEPECEDRGDREADAAGKGAVRGRGAPRDVAPARPAELGDAEPERDRGSDAAGGDAGRRRATPQRIVPAPPAEPVERPRNRRWWRRRERRQVEQATPIPEQRGPRTVAELVAQRAQESGDEATASGGRRDDAFCLVSSGSGGGGTCAAAYPWPVRGDCRRPSRSSRVPASPSRSYRVELPVPAR